MTARASVGQWSNVGLDRTVQFTLAGAHTSDFR